MGKKVLIGGVSWKYLLEEIKEEIFLLDSFGFIGLKEFVIDNDKKRINKCFYGLEQINKKDKRINLTYVQFDLEAFKHVNKKQLAATAQDFFHTLNEFAKVYKRKLVNIFMVDDQLQNLQSDTCGLFQL